jgi:hypothetical protein
VGDAELQHLRLGAHRGFEVVHPARAREVHQRVLQRDARGLGAGEPVVVVHLGRQGRRPQPAQPHCVHVGQAHGAVGKLEHRLDAVLRALDREAHLQGEGVGVETQRVPPEATHRTRDAVDGEEVAGVGEE